MKANHVFWRLGAQGHAQTHNADQPHCLETTQLGCIIHGACAHPQLFSCSLWNLHWQSLTDLTVFNARRSHKITVKKNLNKVRTEPWQNAWRNLHDVSRTYASTICRGDFVVVFSVAFSVLSVASPWRYSAFIGPFCRVRSFLQSSFVHIWFPPVLLVCMQPGLPQRVSTKCLCLCSWVNHNKLDWAIGGILNTQQQTETKIILKQGIFEILPFCRKLAPTVLSHYWPFSARGGGCKTKFCWQTFHGHPDFSEKLPYERRLCGKRRGLVVKRLGALSKDEMGP